MDKATHFEPQPPTAHPAKSALKKDLVEMVVSGSVLPPYQKDFVIDELSKPTTAPSSTGKRTKKKNLTWDEPSIEEHDLLRGTRMKIDEPNTPFIHYDQDSDGDSSAHPKTPPGSQTLGPDLALHWGHLETRLGAVAAARDEHPPSSPSASSQSCDSETEQRRGEERRKKIRTAEFRQQRSSHYDEVEAMKQWRTEKNEDIESETDEED